MFIVFLDQISVMVDHAETENKLLTSMRDYNIDYLNIRQKQNLDIALKLKIKGTDH